MGNGGQAQYSIAKHYVFYTLLRYTKAEPLPFGVAPP